MSTLRTGASRVFFDRKELFQLLTVYGRMVAAGEWRDYAMDALPDRAVFSIYKRTGETPLFQVEKVPSFARKQGIYCVRGTVGQALRRGHELAAVLKALEPRRMQAVS